MRVGLLSCERSILSTQTCHILAGGLPGPQFQALPEPAPLPPLPRPAPMLQMEQPAEANAFAAMAPMAAPGGEAQPGSALQVQLRSSQHS